VADTITRFDAKSGKYWILAAFFVFDGLRYFGLLRPELVTQREE
jgi:hypothetical protein